MIDLLHRDGSEPVNAARRGFQLHEIRFACRIDLETAVASVGDTRPELVPARS